LFITSVIVQSNSRILQFLHQMFNVSFAAGRCTLKMCCYRNLQKSSHFNCCFWDADISQGSVATQLRWDL